MYPITPQSAGLASLTNFLGADGTQKKKPALYRAGQAVGAVGSAAHNIAAAGDRAADTAISNASNAVQLGGTNFLRGVRGQPALDALPAAAPADPAGAAAPAAKPVGAASPTAMRMPVLFNPSIQNGAITSDRLGTFRADADPASTTPVAARGIDTGVTLPDGRKLPYGSMVNGVPTFSDGSGGPGAIPRTMTQADIADLGKRLNVVPTASLTRAAPAFNSDNSEQNVQAILNSRQGSKFGITPEMNANADLAAVTNQDARTTLGRAALNTSRRANAATTTLQRKAALDDLAGLNAAVRQNAVGAIQNEGANQRANIDAQATLQRQGLANAGDLARQGLANEGDLARTDLAGQYDVASRLAQGQARTGLTEKDLNNQAIKLLPQVIGIDPTTGMIADPNAPGGMRSATAQELAAGLDRAKAIIQGQLAPRASSAAPKAGDVVSGYRFKGGNPNDQSNWEKV